MDYTRREGERQQDREKHSETHTHRNRGNEAGTGPILEGSRLKASPFFSFMMKPVQQTV